MRHSTIVARFGLGLAMAAAGPARAEPVPLPATLYRALSTGGHPERAAGLRSELRAALLPGDARPAWDADCEQARLDSDAAPGLPRQRLPDGSWLLRVECSAGAYQGSFWAAHLWRKGGRGQAALLTWPVATEAVPPAAGVPYRLTADVVVWGEATVQADGTVEIVNRFRGIGDCGTRSRYALRQGSLRIVTLAAVFSCPDTPATVPLGPPDWPVIGNFDH